MTRPASGSITPIAGKSVLFVMAAEAEYGPHLRRRFVPLMTGVGPVEAGVRLGAELVADRAVILRHDPVGGGKARRRQGLRVDTVRIVSRLGLRFGLEQPEQAAVRRILAGGSRIGRGLGDRLGLCLRRPGGKNGGKNGGNGQRQQRKTGRSEHRSPVMSGGPNAANRRG